MKTFDLNVVGSGPSGGRVAMTCAEAGWDVAIVESRMFGGNCALRGCNPKKVFVHAAEVVDAARRGHGKLCDLDGININWRKLVSWKNTFTQPVPESAQKKFKNAGITTFEAEPKFVSHDVLKIGNDEYHAKNILIATGGTPAALQFAGSEHLTLSDQFMEQESIPKRVVFVGGGYISMEFAFVARHADCDVTVLQRPAQILEGFESFTVDKLIEKAVDVGISIRCSADVTEIKQSNDGAFEVCYTRDGESQTALADLVVHGAGRVPNLTGLDLKTGNVDFDPKKGVAVSDCLRSVSNPIVFAAGDCAATDKARLTPTANQQGFAIAETMIEGRDKQPDYGPIPKVAFTIPPIASVGLTEKAVNEAGESFRVESGDMSEWGSVRKICETHAAFKLIICSATDQILGAHLFGPAASKTINLFAVAMRAKMTASDLKSTLLAFPTFTSNVRQMV